VVYGPAMTGLRLLSLEPPGHLHKRELSTALIPLAPRFVSGPPAKCSSLELL
jgi:hypothetical protein